MNTKTARHDKRGRVLRTAEERQELVAKYKSSGLSMTAYCEREGLKLATLSHWVHKSASPRKRRDAQGRKGPMKFAEVKMALSGAPAVVEVELSGGTRIRVRDAGMWPVIGKWLQEAGRC
jgi:transposase-like protein